MAVSTLDRRLEGMNEFRAALVEQQRNYALGSVVDTERVDTRRRFELLEAKLHDLEKRLGRDLRAEVRPVQDHITGQAAIIAAVVACAAILGSVIIAVNFLVTRL